MKFELLQHDLGMNSVSVVGFTLDWIHRQCVCAVESGLLQSFRINHLRAHSRDLRGIRSRKFEKWVWKASELVVFLIESEHCKRFEKTCTFSSTTKSNLRHFAIWFQAVLSPARWKTRSVALCLFSIYKTDGDWVNPPIQIFSRRLMYAMTLSCWTNVEQHCTYITSLRRWSLLRR